MTTKADKTCWRSSRTHSHGRIRLCFLLLPLVLALLCTGCGGTDGRGDPHSPATPPPAPAEYPAPEPGQSLTDALASINHCWFEWIALGEDGVTNLCHTGYTSDGLDRIFCAIFTNGVLSRVVFSPTNRVVFSDLGSQRDPPDFRIPDVLASTNSVSLDNIKKRPRPANPPKQSVDWGLTAAYLLVRTVCTPVSLFTSKTPKSQPLPDADDERLARFNPFTVPLGGSREECERRIGKPLIAPPNAARDGLFIYGETPAFSENEKRCVLGVEYRNGRAIRVVTLNLLDWEALAQKRREKNKAKRRIRDLR